MAPRQAADRTMSFSAIVEEPETGCFVAQCVELPSVIAQGETLAGVTASIKMTLEAILTARRAKAKQALESGAENRHLKVQRIDVIT